VDDKLPLFRFCYDYIEYQMISEEEIKKSDLNLEMGVDGHTKYLQGVNVPIMVNSVFDSENHCTPTDVSEMHLGTVNGKQILLITPSVISLPE